VNGTTTLTQQMAQAASPDPHTKNKQKAPDKKEMRET